MTGSTRVAFTPVAPGVHVLRYPVLDVNVTLIVGAESALLVDTLATANQARQLVAAVRALTPLPVTVVNTHAHFDHCFGNAVLAQQWPGLTILAHQSTVDAFADPQALRRGAVEEAWELAPSIAEEVAAAPLLAPTTVVTDQSTVDLGGRVGVLRYLGRGHTAGDLVVHVPDASVVVAGDLVEEGAPPSFADSYPLDWPETLAGVLALQPSVVIPGHGAVVDAAFVDRQRAELSRLEWLIRDGDRNLASAQEVAAGAPFGPDAALVAVRRGYAVLSGRD
jgi:glyoxylase-like metal-dependent hydrolase (beta-lactamase superfamily II)